MDTPDPNLWDSDECGQAEDAPSSQPTSSPTDESQKDCEFFFTELSDSDNSPFIEIASTCPGAKISRPLTVVSYKEFGQSCEVDLQGMIVPSDGFIILCRNKSEHEITYSSWDPEHRVCDIEDSQLFIGHGYNSYAIVNVDDECDRNECEGVNCSFGCNDKYLDIYGFVGSSLKGTIYAYADCRVARKILYPYGLYPFDANVFEVGCRTSSVDPGDLCSPPAINPYGVISDPRLWESNPTLLFISEICDPVDDPNKRFIELYSPNKRNYVIDEEMMIVKWSGSSPNPSYYFQPLMGQEIDENGFLVVCQNFYTFGSSSCDIASGPLGIAALSGSDHFGIFKGCATPYDTCETVDLYGIPGTSAQDTAQDFSGGRAYRPDGFDLLLNPYLAFDISEWVVQRNVPADMCDPGCLTPSSPVAPSPVQPSPTGPTGPTGPSKGKGKSKKRLRH